MKKLVTLFSVAALFFSCQNQAQKKQTTTPTTTTTPMAKETIYQFKVEDLSGDTFDFSTLKGKKILVVNTASECGLTQQYEQLQAIYENIDSYFISYLINY